MDFLCIIFQTITLFYILILCVCIFFSLYLIFLWMQNKGYYVPLLIQLGEADILWDISIIL